MTSRKQFFQQIIADFIENPLTGIISREIDLPHDVAKIISLLGPRRSGKTYLLFDLIVKLRKTVPANRLVYVNLEDDRLFPLKLEDLDAMLQGYYELYPENKDELVYFFLDEVQEVDHWEKFVRRIYDQEKCRIYLTGSSSRLLSRELATTLRGRTIPYEVFPLSFREFLTFQQIEVNPATSKGKALLMNRLKSYLQQGGFPELIFMPLELHKRIINEYIDLMLYRDLSERFSLKHPHMIKYLLKYLLNHLSQSFSVNKVFQDLKSQGYTVGKNTVYDYISYLEEAFIIFRAQIWSRSIRKQAINPDKVYVIDPAFKHAMSISEDIGRIFENAVFMELRRRGLAPSYFLQKQEVDFYWENGQLINACYEYSSETTKRREVQSLIEAMDYLQLSESYLITWDQHTEISQGGKTIFVRPLWAFLLEKP